MGRHTAAITGCLAALSRMGVDDGQGQAVVLRSFVSSVPLKDYGHYVRLPQWGT